MMVSSPPGRLYEAIDVWGLTAKLETYLRNKRSARERAERAAGGGNASAWGVFGGGAGGVKKGKPEGAAALETRRREEAERIRGQLSRSYEPRQWERVSKRRGMRYLGDDSYAKCVVCLNSTPIVRYGNI